MVRVILKPIRSGRCLCKRPRNRSIPRALVSDITGSSSRVQVEVSRLCRGYNAAMRTVTWLVMAVMAWGGTCLGALGAGVTGVTLPLGAAAGGPGERQWEMLAVDVAPVSGEMEVGVQDVRGGVQV